MQELFRMDSGDYNPDGPVFCRPSARGIIEKDGKFLLMHSRTNSPAAASKPARIPYRRSSARWARKPAAW